MFTSARLKLTAWYLLIIMLVSIAFSVAIYQVLNNELTRVERVQRLRQQSRVIIPGLTRRLSGQPAIDPEVISETENRLRIILIVINLSVLAGAGFAGYFLAGRTLQPIKLMVEEQNRFITDASHELRTPITSLKSEIEVNLRDKNLNKETKNLLESNLEEVNSLQALSDNLIALTQYQNTNNNIHFSEVSLQVVVKEACRKVATLAKHKSISINNQVKDFNLEGDKSSLIELFVIFLDNAIKYSNKNTKVLLTSKKTDHSIAVYIKDQGVGIEKKDLPFLYDRFYRVDKARSKTDIEGFGLGLSIAKQIAEKHNGIISVDSKTGKGTTFTIEFPVNNS